jgi:hypothetical protein
MQQDRVVNHILRDLKQFGLITKDITGEYRTGEYRPYLNAVYVAGFEQGRLEINQHGNKTIGQYDQRGKLVNTFKSRKEASLKTGFNENTIYKNMFNNTVSKQGWTWKYL